MPHATGLRRGQPLHHGQQRCEHADSPPATVTHSISSDFKPQQQSNAAHHAPPRTSEVI
jgi:hypothetical protein